MRIREDRWTSRAISVDGWYHIFSGFVEEPVTSLALMLQSNNTRQVSTGSNVKTLQVSWQLIVKPYVFAFHAYIYITHRHPWCAACWRPRPELWCLLPIANIPLGPLLTNSCFPFSFGSNICCCFIFERCCAWYTPDDEEQNKPWFWTQYFVNLARS